MTAELPSLNINDAHLDLSAGILTLSGEKKIKKELSAARKLSCDRAQLWCF
ncbi:MAG: hypothetical protein ACI8R9_002050 [Paraglaciecola sp.]|jgi:hypothetical protein